MGQEGAHARITQGIGLAKAEGFKVAVNMVVTQKNIQDVFSTAKYVAGLGVTTFAATKGSKPPNSPDFRDYSIGKEGLNLMLMTLLRVRDELDLSVDSLEFYPYCAFDLQATRDVFGNRICSAGKTSCTIGYDGLIRPCSHAPMTYGSIEDGLKTAWLSLREWRTDAFVPIKCVDCPVKNFCEGGCKIEAFTTSGKLSEADPYCDFRKVPLAPTPKPDSAVRIDSLLKFNSNLRMREENFGGILFASPSRWLPVTPELYIFTQHRQNLGEFSINDLSKALGSSEEDALLTAASLLNKSIIERKEVRT